MNDSFGNGGFDTMQTSTAVPAEKKPEGVVPMVIMQILQSPEDGLTLWGIKLGIVTFVAIVRAVDHSSTKITYRLEDHTGQIDAHLWLEEGDTLTAPQVVVNAYARVYGSVRNQGGGKTIMIFKLEPMPSINELTNHLLEVLNARFRAQEVAKKGAGFGDNEFGYSESNAGAFVSGGNNAPASNPLGFNNKQLAVFEAIKNHLSEQGISSYELQRKFSHIPASELESITDYMTQEGHIYTSVDAEHFLSTDV